MVPVRHDDGKFDLVRPEAMTRDEHDTIQAALQRAASEYEQYREENRRFFEARRKARETIAARHRQR